MGVSEGIDRMTPGKRSWPRTAHIGVAQFGAAQIAEPTPIDSMGCMEGLMHPQTRYQGTRRSLCGHSEQASAKLIDCL